jgi:NifU-like protein involved in Fe-S cluster formation/predicted Fe-Mo cluster-binding NifX family protein
MASGFEFSAVAIDHAQNPRHVGPLDSFDGHARITGHCGETMEFWLQVCNGRIRRASFITDGCASSAACGSMATELATGGTVEEAYCIEQKDVLDALGGLPQEIEHCALLAAETLRAACEDFIRTGQPFVNTQRRISAKQAFTGIGQSVLAQLAQHDVTVQDRNTLKENNCMKIAIPVANGHLSAHFGHCEAFAILESDQDGKAIASKSMHQAPPHEPGLLPRWLHELGANVIIAGGMGQRAQQLFAENGITVVVGAPAETPEKLASAYLGGTLQAGENICDH